MNIEDAIFHLLDEDFQEDECRRRMTVELSMKIADEVGPVKKRRIEVNRRRAEGGARLMQDYFAENPTYGADKFRARFRMSKEIFFIVLEEVTKQDDYFVQKTDAAKRMGFSPIKKVTAALRMLAYGCSADQLELASYDLWISHAFFGLPGTLNDINVLDRSDLLNDVTTGKEQPAVNYAVNGNSYDMGYYFTDGIYPEYATFVKAPRHVHSMTPKQKVCRRKLDHHLANMHFLFNVSFSLKLRMRFEKTSNGRSVSYKQRFQIVAGPARMWDLGVLHDIMTTCIILHNLIVERQRQGSNEGIEVERGEASVPLLPREEIDETFGGSYLARTMKVIDRAAHHQLRHDLTEHLWNRVGDSLEE
ncbi:hypothetical protein [Absidia glauca]|uniref:Uncharacterized protein n=1 Tax=Absidia glauca TaxID=4829 RepID=A0A163MM77_ABSGL|nr:hypothetical protein [Absidia glauca]